MIPEAERFLQKARQHLDRGRTMLGVSLYDDAGRAAYLAAFHAAQAFIFASTAKVLKTHRGVQAEFLRLTKNDRHFAPDERVFLSQAYNYKAIADYETGPGAGLSAERAAAAVEAAGRFVMRVAHFVPPAPPVPRHHGDTEP